MRFLVVYLGILFAWPQISTGETLGASRTCEGIDIIVTAPEPALIDLVCNVAIDQAARLAACGVHSSRTVSVAVVPRIEGQPENCVGAFHCSSDQIEIVLPQTLAGRETPNFIYSGLDPDVAFASILRHELTHAVMEHTTEDRPISNAAHEYIAFAFQIDAMTDDERDVFLATDGQRPAKSLDTFNMFIYGLLPGAYASASWLHFSMPGHGCDFVGKIISGEVVLGAPRLSPP